MKYHLNLDIEFKKNPYKGKFIVIEGIDGAGKTTQVSDIAKILSKKHSVFQTKNPTDEPIGKFIRKVLGGKIKVPPVAFQYLFSADREAQQEEVIEHLKKGEIVIMDRYIWSALAYGILDHGYEELERTGHLLLVALSILSMYHRFILPDLTIYLDINVPTSVKRLRQLGRYATEIYKKEEKIPKAKRSYEWIIKEFGKQITVIDGQRPKKEVTREILSKIEPLLKK